jgi:hypothetical protein
MWLKDMGLSPMSHFFRLGKMRVLPIIIISAVLVAVLVIIITVIFLFRKSSPATIPSDESIPHEAVAPPLPLLLTSGNSLTEISSPSGAYVASFNSETGGFGIKNTAKGTLTAYPTRQGKSPFTSFLGCTGVFYICDADGNIVWFSPNAPSDSGGSTLQVTESGKIKITTRDGKSSTW